MTKMSRLIKPIGKGKSKFIPAAEAMKKLDEIIAKEEAAKKAPAQTKPAAGTQPKVCIFRLDDLPDRYVMHNVSYNNSVIPEVHWSKQSFIEGVVRTHYEFTTMTSVSKDWYLPHLPLIYASIRELYIHRDTHDIHQRTKIMRMRDMFKQDFTEGNLFTSTTVVYDPTGNDTVIHNRGYVSKSPVQTYLALGLIEIGQRSQFGQQIDALFCTQDIVTLASTFEWLLDSPLYINFPSKQQGIVQERAVITGGSQHIDATGDMSERRLARGVMTYTQNQDAKK